MDLRLSSDLPMVVEIVDIRFCRSGPETR